jgi:hypothetical protein
MNILFLTIKKQWFDMIKTGEKKEEYRDIKPYFDRKLVGKKYDAVLFQNGYAPDSPRLLIEYKGYEKKRARPEWSGGFDGLCYAIKLGSVIELSKLHH